MPKPTKTRAELEAMVMDDLRHHPECSEVNAVAFRSDRPWDIAAIGRDGTSINLECDKRIWEIIDRLRAQYDLEDATGAN